MTTVQQARVRGFEVQLVLRGITLTCEDGKTTFRALINKLDPMLDQFELGPAQRTARVICVLRDAYNALNGAVSEQSKLFDVAGKAVWTVAWIQDDPINVCVELHANQEQA